MDLKSMIEMDNLHYKKEIRRPSQAPLSTLQSSASSLPISTATVTSATHDSRAFLPPSTPNYEPDSLANPFALPFQTLLIRSHSSTTPIRLFVRTSTLHRIPFFSQKSGAGELKNEEDFYMLEESDDADSLGLLLGFIQDQKVSSLPDQDDNIDDATRREKVLAYVRAYPLAGKLGLESLQNQMVDCLIAHYLEYPVSATDVGILIQAGVANSKLGTLLMCDLARGMLDGSLCEGPRHGNVGSETSITNPSITPTILEEIQQSWTIQDTTTLIAMMAEAHKDAKDPTKRSPMELAAADPCTIHIHLTTEICQKRDSATGKKRKRAVDEWDESDNDEIRDGESDADGQQEDDFNSVCSSSSEVIKVPCEQAKLDKENARPSLGACGGLEKEVGDNVKTSGPIKKRRKLAWLFGQ